ncbi:MAG: hypothetical protein Q4C72_07620 [Eubacteriales bacterium]|nr:hypothetical protein [Eubacteriales bacterium]
MLKLVKLFPQYMLLPVIGGLALLGVGIYMVLNGVSFLWAALLLIIGCVILYIIALSSAVGAHQDRIAWLYRDLEPERFLEKYSKLLPRAQKYPEQEVTVRAHLANGHAALGEFDKALELLDNAPKVDDQALKILLLNNRAQIYFQTEQADKGKECLDQMRVLIAEGGDQARAQYAESERMLQCHYDALTSVCHDDAYLRTIVRDSTAALFRVNASLLLARVYLSQGETEMARSYLEETVEKGRDWLWPTQKARQMLETMQK